MKVRPVSSDACCSLRLSAALVYSKTRPCYENKPHNHENKNDPNLHAGLAAYRNLTAYEN